MPRVFLSHSTQDKDFVENLASRLTKAGLDVWYDKWEIRVGDSIAEKIEDGISASDFLIVVLSKNSVKSPWVRRELDAAITREISRKGAYILPVLAENCEIPPLLAGKRYANFTTTPDQAFEELIEAVVSRRASTGAGTSSEAHHRTEFVVDTIQLYTTAEGNDFSMYEGEEKRGLDHVITECESTMAAICAFLITDVGVEPWALNREKGSFFQKIGYPNGSLSALIARSQDDFLQWEAEVVAEMNYDANPVMARKIFAGLVKNTKWQGIRYLVQASLDAAKAAKIFTAKGFRIIRYLPSPSPMFQLNIPSWQLAQHHFAPDKKEVSPAFSLEQLSPSLLRITIAFEHRFPDIKCWPHGHPWAKLSPRSVLREFRDALRSARIVAL